MAVDDGGARKPGAPEDDAGFGVTDRRRFDPATGAPRAEAGGTPLPGGGVLQAPGAESDDIRLPVGFADLVQPFVLVCLAGLGVLPDPDTQQPEINLRAAAAAIECLELLRAKTEQTRTPEETRFLEQALYELKMQFVEARERRRGA